MLESFWKVCLNDQNVLLTMVLTLKVGGEGLDWARTFLNYLSKWRLFDIPNS